MVEKRVEESAAKPRRKSLSTVPLRKSNGDVVALVVNGQRGPKRGWKRPERVHSFSGCNIRRCKECIGNDARSRVLAYLKAKTDSYPEGSAEKEECFDAWWTAALCGVKQICTPDLFDFRERKRVAPPIAELPKAIRRKRMEKPPEMSETAKLRENYISLMLLNGMPVTETGVTNFLKQHNCHVRRER